MGKVDYSDPGLYGAPILTGDVKTTQGTKTYTSGKYAPSGSSGTTVTDTAPEPTDGGGKVTSSRVITDKEVSITVQESGLTTIKKLDTGEQYQIQQVGAIGQAQDISLPQLGVKAQEKPKKKTTTSKIDLSGLAFSPVTKKEPDTLLKPSMKDLLFTDYKLNNKGQDTQLSTKTKDMYLPKDVKKALTFTDFQPDTKGQETIQVKPKRILLKEDRFLKASTEKPSFFKKTSQLIETKLRTDPGTAIYYSDPVKQAQLKMALGGVASAGAGQALQGLSLGSKAQTIFSGVGKVSKSAFYVSSATELGIDLLDKKPIQKIGQKYLPDAFIIGGLSSKKISYTGGFPSTPTQPLKLKPGQLDISKSGDLFIQTKLSSVKPSISKTGFKTLLTVKSTGGKVKVKSQSIPSKEPILDRGGTKIELSKKVYGAIPRKIKGKSPSFFKELGGKQYTLRPTQTALAKDLKTGEIITLTKTNTKTIMGKGYIRTSRGWIRSKQAAFYTEGKPVTDFNKKIAKQFKGKILKSDPRPKVFTTTKAGTVTKQIKPIDFRDVRTVTVQDKPITIKSVTTSTKPKVSTKLKKMFVNPKSVQKIQTGFTLTAFPQDQVSVLGKVQTGSRKVKQTVKTVPKSKQITTIFQEQPLSIKQESATDLFLNQDVTPSQSQRIAPVQLTQLQPTQEIVPAPGLFPEQAVTGGKGIPSPFIPTVGVPPLTFGAPLKLPKSKKRSKDLVDGFDVLVRQKGKDIKVNKKPLSEIQAINLGLDITDNTVAASFEPVPSNKKAPKPFFEFLSNKKNKF